MDEAQIIAFLKSQASKISEEVGADDFQDIKYTLLVTIDDSGPEWDPQAEPYEAPEFDYYLSLDQAMGAMRSGVELPRDDARRARRTAMRRLDDIVFHGDADHGWQGLINSSIARRLDYEGPESQGRSQEQKIISEINRLLFHSDGNRFADTLLLPWTLFTDYPHLKEFLLQRNVYTETKGKLLTLRGLRMLDKAGDHGTRRAVAYAKGSLKLHLPMPPRFLEPFRLRQAADTFRVQGVFRTSGLKISGPEGIRYLDGI